MTGLQATTRPETSLDFHTIVLPYVCMHVSKEEEGDFSKLSLGRLTILKK